MVNMPDPGRGRRIIGRRYQLESLIEQDEVWETFRGHDLRLGRKVAIKALRDRSNQTSSLIPRFQQGLEQAASLQHVNIIQLYDYGQADDTFFLVMELLEGTSLRRYLQSRGKIRPDRMLIIAHDVATGLGFAHHKNIIHGAVKPENVWVGRDGSVKLGDFGIASLTEQLTLSGMISLAVRYYAPEQRQGKVLTPASDVYACGRMMYEMLAGRLPFKDDTPIPTMLQPIEDEPMPLAQVKPDIPPALEQLVMRCLEKNPERRFRDGYELAHAQRSTDLR